MRPMGRFLLGDEEELLRAFRPHILSWTRSYAAAFLWMAWGWLGMLARGVVDDQHVAYAVFLLLAALHGFLRARAKGPRAWIAHSMGLGVIFTAWVLDASGRIPTPFPEAWTTVLVGAGLVAVSLVVREATRWASMTYLTSQRVVIRRGLAPRTETVVAIRDIKETPSIQHLLGGIFGFGRIRLVRGTKRVKNAEKDEIVEDSEELRGVPRFEETRRDLNALIEEARMPVKDRRKRLEERRLKDSMIRLTQWKPGDRP
jgi:hypothetical protein